MHSHGGKREGSGHPKGSVNKAGAELRQSAQEHTQDALGVLVEIMNKPDHPQQLKAAELVLQRGHGAPKEEPASFDIISRFVSGDISAIAACLKFEAEGLKVSPLLQTYFDEEMKAATATSFLSLSDEKRPLPRR